MRLSAELPLLKTHCQNLNRRGLKTLTPGRKPDVGDVTDFVRKLGRQRTWRLS